MGILAAQHLLSASPFAPAAPAPALPYKSSAELAAAGPARLLLAVAGCLRQQYDMLEACGQNGNEGDGRYGGTGGRPDAALLETASALRAVRLAVRQAPGGLPACGGGRVRQRGVVGAGAAGGGRAGRQAA